MARRRLSSKSQTMLPEAVREALHLKEGDELDYYIEDGRVIMVKAGSRLIDDPFANFTEWDSEADHEAYDKL